MAPQLEHLKIRGYKSIADADLPLSRILNGANGDVGIIIFKGADLPESY